jgi:hypothetical protein
LLFRHRIITGMYGRLAGLVGFVHERLRPLFINPIDLLFAVCISRIIAAGAGQDRHTGSSDTRRMDYSYDVKRFNEHVRTPSVSVGTTVPNVRCLRLQH